MRESLKVLSPVRENGSLLESTPKRTRLINGNLVHLSQHRLDETPIYKGRGPCLNEIGIVTNAFRGGQEGDAKCTECSYVQRVGVADRIRRKSS